MSACPSPGSDDQHHLDHHLRGKLIRQKLVQRLCGQVVMSFGAFIFAVSLYKLVSAIFLGGSLVSEMQLGLAGLLLVFAGRFLRYSTFLKSLLSDLGASGKLNRSLFVLVVSVIIMGSMVLLKLSVQDTLRYKRLLGEGGILEYLQALTLFTSAWMSLLISRDLWERLLLRFHSVAYGIISFALLFVGLEELAWGQVLFGWRTPENIASLNAQNQTTIHNLEFFQDYLDMNLFLVSLLILALVLWRPSLRALKERFSRDEIISPEIFFLPRYFWPLFFCAAFLSYFVATRSATKFILNIDQEWAEFMLYLAFGIGLLRTYILLSCYSRHCQG